MPSASSRAPEPSVYALTACMIAARAVELGEEAFAAGCGEQLEGVLERAADGAAGEGLVADDRLRVEVDDRLEEGAQGARGEDAADGNGRGEVGDGHLQVIDR